MPAHGGLLAILNGEFQSENICFEDSWITTSANIEYQAVLGDCAFAEMGCMDSVSCDYNTNALWQVDEGVCLEYPITTLHDCNDICIAGEGENYYGYEYGIGSNGDVNNDGNIDVLDITYMVEYVIGMTDFNNMQLCVGDINYSNIVNITDIVVLVHYISGL